MKITTKFELGEKVVLPDGQAGEVIGFHYDGTKVAALVGWVCKKHQELALGGAHAREFCDERLLEKAK